MSLLVYKKNTIIFGKINVSVVNLLAIDILCSIIQEPINQPQQRHNITNNLLAQISHWTIVVQLRQVMFRRTVKCSTWATEDVVLVVILTTRLKRTHLEHKMCKFMSPDISPLIRFDVHSFPLLDCSYFSFMLSQHISVSLPPLLLPLLSVGDR